jgi:hypothetical protein
MREIVADVKIAQFAYFRQGGSVHRLATFDPAMDHPGFAHASNDQFREYIDTASRDLDEMGR